MNEEEQRSKDENPLEKHVESRPPSGKEMMMWDSMLSHREGFCSCGKFHSNSGGAAEICEVREGCQKVHVVGRSASSIQLPSEPLIATGRCTDPDRSS